MKLYSWNVNGIRAASKKGYEEWFKLTDPDILCLQETKAQPDQLESETVNPEGYHSFWNSAQKKGYSGVVTFSKVKPNSVTYGLGIEKFDNEGRVIELEYDKFNLFNIYFPNSQRDIGRIDFKIEFCDTILERCNILRDRGKSVIVCGDYNIAHKEIDLKNPKSNQKTAGFLPEERAWMDKFITHGYVDTFREFNKEPGNYTWWSYMFSAREKNIGWRIDYFCVNKNFSNQVNNSFILPEVMGSDHCPVGLEIDV